MSGFGTTTVDFGAFPGKSDVSKAITGQGGILSGSLVEAWLRPEATADHTADEHLVESIKIMAGNIVAATGFTIYGFNTSQLNEPLLPLLTPPSTALGPTSVSSGGGKGTRLYGQYTVAWAWS